MVAGLRLDHLCVALDGVEKTQAVSRHAQSARVMIIMENLATEMIFTPRWYTVAQVAQLLNYGESKVRMLIITGQLRSIKDGRSRRILPEWVEALRRRDHRRVAAVDEQRTHGRHHGRIRQCASRLGRRGSRLRGPAWSPRPASATGFVPVSSRPRRAGRSGERHGAPPRATKVPTMSRDSCQLCRPSVIERSLGFEALLGGVRNIFSGGYGVRVASRSQIATIPRSAK